MTATLTMIQAQDEHNIVLQAKKINEMRKNNNSGNSAFNLSLEEEKLSKMLDQI